MLRRSIITAWLALALCFLMLWLRDGPARPLPPPTPGPVETAARRSSAPETPAQIRVLNGDAVLTLPLEEYLVGVVAAEMPAAFEPEALRAQAVAARTYTLYCARTGRHAQADVCTDYGCCQAWRSEDELRESWGEDFGERLARIRSAVEVTAGETLSYGGEPALAVFHSSSPGSTEESAQIWNALPYLVSVSSPETARDVPGFVSELRCAPLDFRDVILSACPEADFSGPEEGWIGPAERDASGRVAFQELGGVAIPGKELRALFSLRSTAFSLSYEDGVFLFTVTGFGHGVGMSQYGAMVMARDGADYREILSHYSPGTELRRS